MRTRSDNRHSNSRTTSSRRSLRTNATSIHQAKHTETIPYAPTAVSNLRTEATTAAEPIVVPSPVPVDAYAPPVTTTATTDSAKTIPPDTCSTAGTETSTNASEGTTAPTADTTPLNILAGQAPEQGADRPAATIAATVFDALVPDTIEPPSTGDDTYAAEAAIAADVPTRNPAEVTTDTPPDEYPLIPTTAKGLVVYTTGVGATIEPTDNTIQSSDSTQRHAATAPDATTTEAGTGELANTSVGPSNAYVTEDYVALDVHNCYRLFTVGIPIPTNLLRQLPAYDSRLELAV